MRALVAAFLAGLAGHAPTTRAAAAHWLALFAGHCEERQLGLADLTPQVLAGYHTRLLWQPNARGRLYAPNSVDQALRWARAWLRWATAQGHLRRDPSRQLVLGRPLRRPRPTWSPAEREALLDRPNPATPVGLRDRALLALFLDTALTRNQLEQLDLADYDPGRQHLALLRGHRRCGPRELVLSDELAELLGRYLAQGRPELVQSPCPALFLSRRGRRLEQLGLAQLLRRYPAPAASSFNRTP